MARILIPVLAVLAVLLAAAGVWIGTQRHDVQAVSDERRAAMDAAGTHAVDVLSLDYRTVDADVARILATSTGEAKAEYTSLAGRLKETTIANKVVQQGVLRATGLVSISGGSARVLVVADADIRWEGAKSPPPPERFYRWQMDLSKVGGVWLVSKAVQIS
ncbi:MAG: hypothetical protein HOY71_01580 [Nonomuraea sp.]|nr:hypothetical protein [Nonomuraea sp.]